MTLKQYNKIRNLIMRGCHIEDELCTLYKGKFFHCAVGDLLAGVGVSHAELEKQGAAPSQKHYDLLKKRLDLDERVVDTIMGENDDHHTPSQRRIAVMEKINEVFPSLAARWKSWNTRRRERIKAKMKSTILPCVGWEPKIGRRTRRTNCVSETNRVEQLVS